MRPDPYKKMEEGPGVFMAFLPRTAQDLEERAVGLEIVKGIEWVRSRGGQSSGISGH